METIKLKKSGNFMWVTDLKTNTTTRFPAKDTYYAFEDKNRVLVLTWDKNNGETYHRYKVSQLVDLDEEPFISFAALDTFLAANLGFNGGGGTSGTTPNLTEVLTVGDKAFDQVSGGYTFQLTDITKYLQVVPTGTLTLDDSDALFPANSLLQFFVQSNGDINETVTLNFVDTNCFYLTENITTLTLNVGDFCELKNTNPGNGWVLNVWNKSIGSGYYLPLAGGTMDAGADIFFDNGSLISEGTYDFGGFGDVVVSGITNTGDGYINGIMGWGDPSGTLWSDLNGTYIKTSVAVTPSAYGLGDIGMHTPEPGTFNYYLENPISMGSPNSAWNGIAYFLAPGNKCGWGDPNNNATTDPVVNYWRLCVLSDYPYVYFTNPSTDPYNFPTSGWVPIDNTIPNNEGGNGYTYIANYGGGFTANISNILNGNGGISRICSIGYEDNWQAGVRYVFDNGGNIRHATNGFNIIPDSSFDYTKRFVVGSLWTLDNGDTYVCTDNSLNAAVWELYSSPASKYKVFTALLTQSGTSDSIPLSSGDSVIKGITYRIDGGSDGDFSNVGAPSNDDSTSFIATINGAPTSYGSAVLLYDPGAPVATVLENTIGNIWFAYGGDGAYDVVSDNLFVDNKTFINVTHFPAIEDVRIRFTFRKSSDPAIINLVTIKSSEIPSNDLLLNTPIEIKVYN